MTSITATNTTIYIQDSSGNISYAIGTPTSWITISAFPVTITNTSPNTSSILTVQLYTDTTFTTSTQYFIFNSQYITFNGDNKTITLSSIANYPGLIQNGTNTINGNDNVVVNNLVIDCTTSTMTSGAGWIGQIYFGYGQTAGCTISNCTTNGAINTYGGGLLGQNTQYCTITNCTSSGVIGNDGGGILGSNCQNCTITKCSSSGVINSYAGGIIGQYASSCTITISFSTGTISTNGGGIYGADSNTCTATNCYSIGAIDNTGGGIYGSAPDNCSATNCYSNGIMNNFSGGIFGSNAVNACNATNCHTTGNIGYFAGGIFGAGFSVDSSAFDCYTTGLLADITKGGILGNSVTIPATCYSEGALSGIGWNDLHANTTLTGINTIWISPSSNTYYLLLAFDTNFYNGATSANVTWGTGNSTTLTITGTGSLFQLFNNTFTGVNINSSSGQMSSTHDTGTSDYTVQLTVCNGNITDSRYYGYNIISFNLTVLHVGCYLEGTLILCYDDSNSQEKYMKIEDIKPGTLVKIYDPFIFLTQEQKYNYRKVIYKGMTYIAKDNKSINPFNYLYCLPKNSNLALLDDLYITGAHGVLEDTLSLDETKMILKYVGFLPKIKDKYLLPAYANSKCTLLLSNTTNIANTANTYYKVYHLALENNNRMSNYGIWANGILSESMSIECFEQSGMNSVN